MQVLVVAEAQVIAGSCLKPFFLWKEGFLFAPKIEPDFHSPLRPAQAWAFELGTGQKKRSVKLLLKLPVLIMLKQVNGAEDNVGQTEPGDTPPHERVRVAQRQPRSGYGGA